MHTILAAAYGMELYDPEGPFGDTLNLWPTIHEDFGVWVHEDNENKINAMLLTMTGEEVFDSAAAFISVCSAFSYGDPGGAVDGFMGDLELPTMLWGIYEISLNRHFSDEDGPVSIDSFSRPVQKLIMDASDDEADEEGVLPRGFHGDLYVHEQKQELMKQLLLLGVAPGVLRFVDQSEETPLHDNEGEVVEDGYEETDFSYAQ